MNQIPVVVPLYRQTPRVAEEIGAYRRCFELGAGGMATVVLAREVSEDGLRRTVALKVLHEHLARDSQVRARFVEEARLLSRVSHPNVCRVLDVGEDKVPFVAMEYLGGEKLSALFTALERRPGALSPFERARLFCRVVAELAEGLHAAHEARDAEGNALGIVHYDVTPDNLFVLYDGTVRVADFGIARYQNRHLYMATTGRLLGKLWYMAPEQVLSEPLDRRVDVWGLGVVLWELLALRRLFRRTNQLDTMRAICSEHVPRLAVLVEGIPEGLDAIIGRALERNPILRYQTTQELAQALQGWLVVNDAVTGRGHLEEFVNGFFPAGRELPSSRSRQQSGIEEVRSPLKDEMTSRRHDRPSEARASQRPTDPSQLRSRTSLRPVKPAEVASLRTSKRRLSEAPRPSSVRAPSTRSALRALSANRTPSVHGPMDAIEAGPIQALDVWASLKDSLWRIAVPVAPVLFTLGLLLAAQLDVSRRPQVALGGLSAVSPQLARLSSGLDATPPRALPATAEVRLVSDLPGVRVFRGDQLLGATPLTLQLPRGPTHLNVQAGTGRTHELHFEVGSERARVVSVEAAH